MTLSWPSPAKLNLFLYITGKRPDGYHNLQTLFQFLDYGDTLTFTPRNDTQLTILTPVEGVADEDNLIIKAAKLLRQYCHQHHIPLRYQGQILVLIKNCPWEAV